MAAGGGQSLKPKMVLFDLCFTISIYVAAMIVGDNLLVVLASKITKFIESKHGIIAGIH